MSLNRDFPFPCGVLRDLNDDPATSPSEFGQTPKMDTTLVTSANAHNIPEYYPENNTITLLSTSLLNLKISQAEYKKLLENNICTMNDVLANSTNHKIGDKNVYILKAKKTIKMFSILPYIEDKINRARIIDVNDYYFPIKRITIAGKPIDDFNPKSARQYILDNLNKINSLIWTIYHNATYNEKKSSLFNSENSAKCKYCTEIDEDIEHTFFSCNRIRLFWNKISEFLNEIVLTNNPPNTITKKDVKERLIKFKYQLPNTEVIHALTLWEIHRVKPEYNLANVNLSGHQMFNRWKINLKNQIIMGCSTSKTSAEQWTKTKTKWFYIEPDGCNKNHIVFN
ncbi:hypothetical protein BB561_000450 [Smittium simulii]|uniref:Reverse transcriptase zinc-binding domain-containing protein n=1 Tax=Smittium simulii TaxID=133385 RepID=A0A2T9YZ47_9FUNG|nr:hypothetical protein BB561_000450 [Smittium simulii]